MNNFTKFIYDEEQTNLSFIHLSKEEKLNKYREILYNDLTKKLRDLEYKKLELIREYQENIKEINNELK